MHGKAGYATEKLEQVLFANQPFTAVTTRNNCEDAGERQQQNRPGFKKTENMNKTDVGYIQRIRAKGHHAHGADSEPCCY